MLAQPMLQPQEKLGKDLEQAAARYANSPEVLLKAGPWAVVDPQLDALCNCSWFQVVSFQGFITKPSEREMFIV